MGDETWIIEQIERAQNDLNALPDWAKRAARVAGGELDSDDEATGDKDDPVAATKNN